MSTSESGSSTASLNGFSTTSSKTTSTASSSRRALVIGGAGFIGTNLADRLARDGEQVVVFDNLSRPGVERNLRWLTQTHPSRVTPVIADVRDADSIRRAVDSADSVFHLAAQVAVTTSIDEPLNDFEVNARGTLNVLEALRSCGRTVPVVFTSTNKVYGALDELEMRVVGRRYEPVDHLIARDGISESRTLDFHSPYGCSKGTADQYALDYARTYGLRSVVLRMSCIYGPHQHGNEDQGWVAHFLIRALEGRPLTLYGNGMQVRDILYADDLVEAFLCAREAAVRKPGRAFNIGGGPARTTSLLELVDLIAELTGRRLEHRFDEWRRGDQRYYVSNTQAFTEATGWTPTVEVRDGVARLAKWLLQARPNAAAGSALADVVN